jgi:glycosyltransferase involved in cell wall biosynthesis
MKSSTVELAYIGSVVPDEPKFHNEAFSRAGNMFQTNLLAGLKADGMEPSVVLTCRPVPAYPRSRIAVARASRAALSCGTPITLLPILNITPIKQILLGFSVLLRLLYWGWKHRGARARLVYTFNLTVPPAIFTLLAARLIRARAIASVNDINVPGETVPPTWMWRFDYFLHKLLLPRFDGLVVVSSAIIDDFAPHVRHVRVEGGIVPEMLPPLPDTEPVPRNLFKVVFAGAMEPVNGVEVMLQAISRIKGEHYRFVFAGSGTLSGAVRQAALEDSRIHYKGFLNFSELLPIYAQADVLINMRLTTQMRTRYFFPSKLMEFMASGTPVISTCTGHVEPEFGQYLLLLKNETPEGLTAAIHQVEALGRNGRIEIGKKARCYILQRKTWRTQAKRVSELLTGLADATGGRERR